MSSRGLVMLLIGVFLAMVGAVLWLGFRVLIPVNPKIAYSPGETVRIPVVKWLLGEIQPVYLYAYSKGDTDYIRVVYRNAKNKMKLLNVMVGNRGQNKLELVGVSVAKDSYKKVGKVTDYGKYFRFGERIKIEYLKNVLARPGTGSEDAIPPDSEEARQLCEKLKTVCYLKDLVFTEPGKYWDFPQTGDLPEGTILSAVSLSKLQTK